MNSLLKVVCLYFCVSFTYSNKSKETKKTFSLQRQTFKSKDDIPKEYIENLKQYFDITDPPPLEEDPVYNKYNFMDYKKNSKTTVDSVDSEQTVEDTNETDTSNETCKSCKQNEVDKTNRIEGIKSAILNRLGFSNFNLPNMTGKKIPRTPSLQKLIEQFDMQGDAPYGGFDEYLPEDEYYGQVQRAYTISQPCK